jgi:small subunit ribosomal protein S2
METTEKEINKEEIDKMFEAGAQYGYSKSRRHPSNKDLIFGAKNRVEIWDLEKTAPYLEQAKEFAKEVSAKGGNILFVGGKNEARASVKSAAEELSMPYVAGRWIGGSLTNFSEIRKRIARYEELLEKKEKGDLMKYTKRERLMFDKEIEDLEKHFKGLVNLKGMPSALFIIDPKSEHIALAEAKKAGIPTIALLNTDCNLKSVDYPIPGNDSALKSIQYFVDEIKDSILNGRLGK